jgi:hypothetical protein
LSLKERREEHAYRAQGKMPKNILMPIDIITPENIIYYELSYVIGC